MALNGDLPAEDATQALETAGLLANDLDSRLTSKMRGEEIRAILLGGLYNAYMEKYRKVVSGRKTGLNDEAQLYLNLLELSKETLSPAGKQQEEAHDVRGMQFKIGLHILNARYNLRNKTMSQFMWPSLPHENTPHDFEFSYNNGWDAAIGKVGFLATHVAPERLRFKGSQTDTEYYPGITLITGQTDLGTRTTAEIVVLALREVSDMPDYYKEEARKKLNEIEARFLGKLSSK